MRSESNLAKIILVLLVVLLAVVLMAIFVNERISQNKVSVLSKEMEEEISPLSFKRDKIYMDLINLENNLDTLDVGEGSAEYLIKDISMECYDSIIKTMIELGLNGTIALSPKNFPGEDNCISVSTAIELQNLGFDFCYMYSDSDLSINTLIYTIKSKAFSNGLNIENVIYFPYDRFKVEYIDVLKNYGVDVVIHHGEERHNLYKTDYLEDIIYVGSEWWWLNNIAYSKFETIKRTSGNLVIEIGLTDFGGYEVREAFESFETKANELGIRITSFKKMKEIQEKNKILYYEKNNNDLQQINEKKYELGQIEYKINEIQKKYIAEISSASGYNIFSFINRK